jgi:hypothetical protein
MLDFYKLENAVENLSNGYENKDNIFCSSNCGKDFKPLIMRMFTNRRHHYLIKLNHFGFN